MTVHHVRHQCDIHGAGVRSHLFFTCGKNQEFPRQVKRSSVHGEGEPCEDCRERLQGVLRHARETLAAFEPEQRIILEDR